MSCFKLRHVKIQRSLASLQTRQAGLALHTVTVQVRGYVALPCCPRSPTAHITAPKLSLSVSYHDYQLVLSREVLSPKWETEKHTKWAMHFKKQGGNMLYVWK